MVFLANSLQKPIIFYFQLAFPRICIFNLVIQLLFMQDVPLKLRLILQPFLVVAACIIALYSLAHWLYILSGLELLNQDVIQFFIPMGLPLIPIYIWLYPRFKLIKPKKDKDQAFNMAMFAWLAIMAPTIIAQMYIDKAVGTLTKLDNVEQINSVPPGKYYELKNCYFDKQYAGFHGRMSVSGKYNNNLDFHLYVVIPFFKDAGDTASPTSAVWLGRVYNKTVNNSGTDEQKDGKYDDFRKTVVEDFNTRDFKDFVYLSRSPKSEDRDNFIKAINRSGRSHPQNLTILTAETEPFDGRTGNQFMWIFIAFAIGTGIYGLIALFQDIDKEKLELFEEGKPTEVPDQEASGASFFIPTPKFFITPLLIDLNIVIYLAMVLCGLGFVAFSGEDLLKWGADYRPVTVNGQWWRLVTSMFLHGGIMHIFGNMFGLFFAGIFLEPVLGRAKYLFAYFITGIIASIASIWWHPATVSIGASGAIFGLFGVFLSLLLAGVFPPKAKKHMLTTVAIFIGYNLIMGLTGGIDNAAHLGGLASGILLGFVLSFTIDKTEVQSEIADGMEGTSVD